MRAVSYIRWSDQHQSKGSSLGRQKALIEAFCDEMGWPIVEQLKDDGKSAFTGANMADGSHLGDFTKRVRREGGQDLVLVVEKMDRLSRRDSFDVLRWIGDMVEAGLTIALVNMKMIVDATSIRNQRAQLRALLEETDAGNEYSKNLSNRIRPAWQAMRDGKEVFVEREGTVTALTWVGALQDVTRVDVASLRGKNQTYWLNDGADALTVGQRLELGQRLGTIRQKVHAESTCPAWLELIENRTAFTIRPDRVALIERMFDLHMAGVGYRGIAKILNGEGVPVFREGRCWHGSTVNKLMGDRGLIGEYIHKVGRRANGQIDPAYFPPVIALEKFQAVNDPRHQAVMAGNTSRAPAFKTIFNDVGRCIDCQSKLQFVSKSRPKDGRPDQYAVCQSAYLNTGCASKRSLRMAPIETAILDRLLSLAMDDVHFASEDQAGDVRRELAEKKRALEDVQRRIDALLDLIGDASFRRDERFDLRLRTAQNEEAAAKDAVDACQTRLQAALGAVSPAEHIRRVAEIRADMWGSDEALAVEARRRVKLAINDLVQVFYVSAADHQAVVILKNGARHIAFDWSGRVTADVPLWRDRARASDAAPVRDYFRRKMLTT